MHFEDSPEEKLVIGSGDRLDWAMQAWAEFKPKLKLHAVDVGQDDNYIFKIESLTNAISGLRTSIIATGFVDWGPQFLNFRRLELMAELKQRGFKLPPLISPRAIIATDVVVGENCSVGPGSIIGSGCKLSYNSVIGSGCIIASNVQIGSSVWIADGVQIGSGCRIGSHSTLGSKVMLSEGISVGRQSILDVPGKRITPVADKTLISTRYFGEVTIVDGSIALADRSKISKTSHP